MDKKRKIIIAGAAVAVLAVGGVAFAISHEYQDRMLLDAVNKTIESEYSQVKGKVTLKPKDLPTVKKIVLDLDLYNEKANFAGTGKIKADFLNGKGEAGLSAVALSKGELYFKLEPIKAKFEAKEDAFALIGKALTEVTMELGDNWYKLSLDDIKDPKQKKITQCVLDGLEASTKQENRKQIVKVFQDNQFWKIEKAVSSKKNDGLKHFAMKIEEKKADKFGKDVAKLDFVKKMEKCGGESVAKSKELVNKTKDNKKAYDTLKEIDFGIKPWTHELGSVSFELKDGKTKLAAEFEMTHYKKAVEVPKSAKNIDKLKEDWEKAAKKVDSKAASSLLNL